MAKVNGLMRGTTGKLGGVVFSKGESGTIAKEYVKPTNPKTGSQVAQRIIWATVTSAAARMAAVINHSWENVAYGKKSKREFVKRNVALLRNYASQDYKSKPAAADCMAFVTTKGVSALVPNAYQISEGSLQKPKSFLEVTDNTLHMRLADALDIPVQKVTVDNTDFYGPTIAAIVERCFGLYDLNEQLSLVVIARTSNEYVYSYNDENTVGYQIPYAAMNARRLVFDPTLDMTRILPLFNANGTVAEDADEVLKNVAYDIFHNAESDQAFMDLVSAILGGASIASELSSGVPATMSIEGDAIALDSYYIYDLEEQCGRVYAAGLVRSRFEDNKWRRSRCFLQLIEPSRDNNNGLIWAIANDAWSKKVELVASERFLNEGGRNEVGENF